MDGRGHLQAVKPHRDANDTGVRLITAGPGATLDTVPGSVTRRPGTANAVVLGLAAMLGAGVFGVWGPAAAAAGVRPRGGGAGGGRWGGVAAGGGGRRRDGRVVRRRSGLGHRARPPRGLCGGRIGAAAGGADPAGQTGPTPGPRPGG